MAGWHSNWAAQGHSGESGWYIQLAAYSRQSTRPALWVVLRGSLTSMTVSHGRRSEPDSSFHCGMTEIEAGVSAAIRSVTVMDVFNRRDRLGLMRDEKKRWEAKCESLGALHCAGLAF